jgi:hypothetical protein
MSRYKKCKLKSQNKCDKCFKVRELLQKISIYKLKEVLTCGLHSLKKIPKYWILIQRRLFKTTTNNLSRCNTYKHKLIYMHVFIQQAIIASWCRVSVCPRETTLFLPTEFSKIMNHFTHFTKHSQIL